MTGCSVPTICDSHVVDALAQEKAHSHGSRAWFLEASRCPSRSNSSCTRWQQRQQQQQPQGAPPTQQSASERPQLNARGFDKIETFVRGKDNWQTWSWKIKTPVSGRHGVLADVMTASETDEDRTIVTVLNDAQVRGVGCGNDRQERDRTGRRGSAERTARQLQLEAGRFRIYGESRRCWTCVL